MTTPDYSALARRVRDRRTQLGLNQDGIAGVSPATMARIESGKPAGPYRDLTLRRLEQALQWPHRTVDAILAGEPDPTEPPPVEIEERLDKIETQLATALLLHEELCNHLGVADGSGLRTPPAFQ